MPKNYTKKLIEAKSKGQEIVPKQEEKNQKKQQILLKLLKQVFKEKANHRSQRQLKLKER